jgi:predicted regulator of amino acid metabolism with ACT domain
MIFSDHSYLIGQPQKWYNIKTLNKKGGKRVDNYDIVLDYFSKAEKPVSAGQIATATGIDKKEVDKAMAKLKKEEKIVSPKVCYWEIKK